MTADRKEGREREKPRKNGLLSSIELDPWFACYGSVAVWIQFIAVGWLRTTSPATADLLQSFAVDAGIAQIAFGVLALALSLLQRRRPHFHPLPHKLTMALCACLPFGPLGVALLLIPGCPPEVSGAVFGIGCISSYILWGLILSHRSDISILSNVLLGQTAGALFVFAMTFVPYEAALACVAVLFLVSGAVLMHKTRPLSHPHKDGPHTCPPNNLPGNPSKARSGTSANRLTIDLTRGFPLVEDNAQSQPSGAELLSSFRKDYLPMVLVFASTVVVALTSGTSIAPTENWTHFGLNTLFIPLAASLVVCVFIALYLRRGASIRQCFVVFPLLSGCAVMLNLVPLDLGPALINDITFALSYLANVFGSTFICIVVRRRPSTYPGVFIFLRTLMALALVASFMLTKAGQGQLVIGVAQGTLLVALLMGVGADWFGEEAGERTRSATQTRQARLEIVAAEHHLSRRETEVAGWLLRGYQAPYIADQMFISENTVRTHIRSIYRKTSCSSRNEFLALFEDGADESRRSSEGGADSRD